MDQSRNNSVKEYFNRGIVSVKNSFSQGIVQSILQIVRSGRVESRNCSNGSVKVALLAAGAACGEFVVSVCEFSWHVPSFVEIGMMLECRDYGSGRPW